MKFEKEITVEVSCNIEELLKILKENDFELKEVYDVNDIYMIDKKYKWENRKKWFSKMVYGTNKRSEIYAKFIIR